VAYNDIFERLVDQSDDPVRGYVAYGIYKKAKREWIQAFKAAHGGTGPTVEQTEAYVATWTPQLITNATDAAESSLAEFAASAIADARPSIVEEALKGNGLKSVLLSMLAAFLYTLLLIGVVIVLKISGVDLLSILQAASPPSSPR
jgi:hypothetical protein